MSKWKECKLVDAAVFQRGHDLPKTAMKMGAIPVAGSNGIIGYHNESTTKGPGLTIGRSGNIGTPKFYQDDFWAHNTVLYVKDFKGNDEKYIFYFLQTFDFEGFNAGSAVPTLNRNHIHEIPVVIPPLPEQRAIAGVLSSLDDKIDLLHRQNKTLEGMAEALWRQMFVVEADPGWIRKPLSNFFPIKTGKKDANYSTEDGQYPFFTCSQNTLNSPGYSFDGHAILLAGNGDFNLKRYNGKFEAYQRTYVLIPHNELEVGFLYYGMRHHLDDITMGYRGSVINFITKGMIENFQLPIIPDTSIFHEACRRFNEINGKIDSNDGQIRTLSRLRDTILPKLINGEVSVGIKEVSL